jgi:hypothetical protein
MQISKNVHAVIFAGYGPAKERTMQTKMTPQTQLKTMTLALALLMLLVGMASQPAFAAKNSIRAFSYSCAPGETVEINVHGTIADPNANNTFSMSNAGSGTVANTPVGSTDTMDVAFTDPSGPVSNIGTSFWNGPIKVTCPPDACPGDAAVFEVTLSVNGTGVAKDTGCVTVRGKKPAVSTAVYAPGEPVNPYEHVLNPGEVRTVSYELTNLDDQAHAFSFIAAAVNSLEPGQDVFPIFPVGGIATFSFIDEFTVEGQIFDLAPGETTLVSFDVQTLPGLEVGSGNTVNLSIIDELTGAAINTSTVVFIVENEPVPMTPIELGPQLRPRRLN